MLNITVGNTLLPKFYEIFETGSSPLSVCLQKHIKLYFSHNKKAKQEGNWVNVKVVAPKSVLHFKLKFISLNFQLLTTYFFLNFLTKSYICLKVSRISRNSRFTIPLLESLVLPSAYLHRAWLIKSAFFCSPVQSSDVQSFFFSP